MGLLINFLFCSDVRTTYSYVLVRSDPVSRVEIDGSRVPNPNRLDRSTKKQGTHSTSPTFYNPSHSIPFLFLLVVESNFFSDGWRQEKEEEQGETTNRRWILSSPQTKKRKSEVNHNHHNHNQTFVFVFDSQKQQSQLQSKLQLQSQCFFCSVATTVSGSFASTKERFFKERLQKLQEENQAGWW